MTMFMCCLFLDRLLLTLGQWICWNKHQPRHLANNRRGFTSCEGTSHTDGPRDGTLQHFPTSHPCCTRSASPSPSRLTQGDHLQPLYGEIKGVFFFSSFVKNNNKSSSEPFHCFLWQQAYSLFDHFVSSRWSPFVFREQVSHGIIPFLNDTACMVSRIAFTSKKDYWAFIHLLTVNPAVVFGCGAMVLELGLWMPVEDDLSWQA